MTWLATAAPGSPGSAIATRPVAVRPLGLSRRLLGVALLAALYFGAAQLGYALNFSGPVAAVLWLPAGVAAAYLSLYGLRFWPGALLGDLLANDWMALPAAGAFGQTAGNLCEVVLAAWLLRRLLRTGSPLDRVRGVGGLLLAFAVATGVSALVGPIALSLAGAVTVGSLPTVMRTWWLGDFCGMLVVVPAALAWRNVPRRLPRGRTALEAALLLAGIAAVSEVAAHNGEPLTYLVFPLLLWTVVRFGVRGGTAALAVTVATTIVTTTRVEGPFVATALTHSVLSTQAFVIVAASSTLLFAAAMTERRALVDRLGVSQARATAAAESERRRIERDLHDGAQQRLLALAARLRLAAAVPTSEAILGAEHELQVAIDELRELSHGTHPAVLTQLGLAGAVRSLAERSTVPVTVLELPPYRLESAAEAAAYYVLTEAVANAHKHAAATAIVLSVGYRLPWLRLSISDDGCGGAVERPGSGLAGLRERVEALDGELIVQSSSHGTWISATIPAFPA